MDLLERVLSCSEEELDSVISEEIRNASENGVKVEQLGMLDYGKSSDLYKGFIPLDTRIKYSSLSIETYSMNTTDFFYEFAHFIRKCNINNKGALIYSLEGFINNYFGFKGTNSREDIFNQMAWDSTSTDEEFFAALENNKIGDLKGKNVAECTERGALAQQILSLFGTETYYCIGSVDLGDKKEDHCFNIVKRKNDYAVLDYSVPVSMYDANGYRKKFYPFVGIISNEEFEKFVVEGMMRDFDEYKYVGNEKVSLDSKRSYSFDKTDKISNLKK